MSLSIEPEMQELLKISAKKAGLSVSNLIRLLVEKYLNLIVNDGEEIPIILKVPSHFKGDEENLRAWFDIKTTAIIDFLCKEKD